MLIKANSISFRYNELEGDIFREQNLLVNEKEVVGIIGESGSGKSTLLKLLAGLLKPYFGKIIRFCSTNGSFVFQTPVLLDWLNVEENIIFPKKYSESTDKKELENLLINVELDWAKKKYPRELSGGMRSRVQLARALYKKVNVLFFDEAFSALDEKLRFQINLLFKNLRNSYNFSAVVVSHSIEEAVFLADRIWIIKKQSSNEPAEISEISDGLLFANKPMSVLKTNEFNKKVIDVRRKLFGENEA